VTHPIDSAAPNAPVHAGRPEFAAPPPVRPLPPLAFWLFRRGIKLREAAAAFGCSVEYVRMICRPFDDPDRRVPTPDVVEAIHAYTQGEIGPADHYPPHLNAVPTAEAELA
jgi:hypothetical protein